MKKLNSIKVCILCILTSILILSLGNPQWNKYIFIFQSNIFSLYQKDLSGLLEPSKNYTGPWNQWYNSGELACQQNYVSGLLHGESKYYYASNGIYGVLGKSGELMLSMTYNKGKITGESVLYSDDGNIDTRTPYLDGKIEGVTTSYYPSGQIKMEMPYQDNKQHGKAIFYYPSGQIKHQLTYLHGNVLGSVTEYSESGDIIKQYEVDKNGNKKFITNGSN